MRGQLQEKTQSLRIGSGRIPETTYLILIIIRNERDGPEGPCFSDLPGLEQIVIHDEEHHAEGHQHRQGDEREVQDLGQGRRPYAQTRVGQRKAVQDRLEHRVQRGHREERTAQEGHRQDDQTVERRHVLMRLGQYRRRHAQHREHHA